MRHKNKTKYLGRTASHRDAMLSNMAASLITHKRIFTTVPKAKALRRYVEPIITRSKEDTTNSRRIVFSMLQNKYAVAELFQSVSPKVSDRPGGYTRIIKTGYRLGDNAAMCFIELVDFNENMLGEDKTKKTRTRRSRRRSGGASAAGAVTETAQATTEAAGTKKASEEAKSEEVKQAEKAAGKESQAPAQVEAEAVPSNEQPVTAEAPATEAPAEEAPAAADEAAAEEPKENEKEVDDAKES